MKCKHSITILANQKDILWKSVNIDATLNGCIWYILIRSKKNKHFTRADSYKPSLQRLMNFSVFSQLKLKWNCDEHIIAMAYPTFRQKEKTFYGPLFPTAPQRHMVGLCFLTQSCNVVMFLQKNIVKANHSLHVWAKVVKFCFNKTQACSFFITVLLSSLEHKMAEKSHNLDKFKILLS